MSNYEDDFFKGKRPWSLIKDAVLSSYIEPYIAKVKKLGRQMMDTQVLEYLMMEEKDHQ